MQAKKLIQQLLEIPEESQTIEFKRLAGSNVVSKILQTIAAMANAEGGNVVLGLADPEKSDLKGTQRIFGIEENRELYDEIIRGLQDITPPLQNIQTEILKFAPAKSLALIKIKKATTSFHSLANQVFLRLHKGNKKLAPQEIIKLNYAKGFSKADRELVAIDFSLLQTEYFTAWREARDIPEKNLKKVLFQTGLARRNAQHKLLPTRAAVLLFAHYPTDLMETKCAIRVYKYQGKYEKFQKVPNLTGKPKTLSGPLIQLIKKAHEYILDILETGLKLQSGFVTEYRIPERAVKEALTNAVIHRDYHLKRDIEVQIFADRLEILSPGLFPYNINKSNIGTVRADNYRNDLLVKHLREFPNAPNLDRNEGVRAMRSEMHQHNLFPPIFITYPDRLSDSVEVILFNEARPSEWEKVRKYLKQNKYINNEEARAITGIIQVHKMSEKLKLWHNKGLLMRIPAEINIKKNVKYKLAEPNNLN